MLSKRASDIIMLSIIGLIAVAIVITRFYLLGVFDERIENIESENAALQEDTAEYDRVLDTYYRDEPLPGEGTLSRYAPAVYSEDYLRSYVYGQLEILGISFYDEEQNLYVGIHEDETFPSGSPFRPYGEFFRTQRVGISFRSGDIDDAHRVVEHFHECEQLFVLMAVEYRVPEEGERTLIEIDFATFYQRP